MRLLLFFLLGILFVLLLLQTTFNFVHGDPKIPCHFIFGDSLFDSGNNNPLITEAKANYFPYGIDFPENNVATGRFTNGLTSADVITKLLEIEGFIQPFTIASGSESLKGVNYASGASGIRPETGSHLGDRIWLARQVFNHGSTIKKIRSYIIGRGGRVRDYLNQCLYTINIGSNDYINNYFMPQYYISKAIFDLDQFASALITEYSRQLWTLYIYGARKIAIFGLGQIGCTPAEIQRNNATQCVEEINNAIKLFNQKLITLIDYFNSHLFDAKFTFIDTIAIQSASPSPSGFNVIGTCCKVIRSDFLCEEQVELCPNRTQYAFFDGYHPTQIANIAIAQFAFNSTNNPNFVHPIDINTLINSF